MVKKINFRRLAVNVAITAFEKHGEDIILLDMRHITAIADYMVLVTVNSPPHARSLLDDIQHLCRRENLLVHHRDGTFETLWQVLDYGGMVIHIMQPEARHYYQLEKLWQDAKKVTWSKK